MSTRDLLDEAHSYATAYLDNVGNRHVGGTSDRRTLIGRLGGPLPEAPSDPHVVLANLVSDADPGLVASVGPRYFGFVTGGAVPVTVAADWLASAWDQNVGMYVMSPALSVMEDIVAGWLLEMLHLPATASVGFVTGAHMANFTCLAAARHEVLRRVGWNVEGDGLQRAPRVTIVAGDHAHVSVIGALRMLGFGANETVRVPVDDQGRTQLEAFERTIAGIDGPLIVCAQAGNVGSGGSDPIAGMVVAAHERGAWVHVDGAFGLWAAAVPELADQVAGIDTADSWTTDAHKWLNVPYDSGLAIVAHPASHRAAMGLQASYLIRGTDEQRAGMDWVPESSRRARVIPLYALFRTLGRAGIQSMIRQTVTLARRMATRLAGEPGVHVLNDVVLNQVLVRFDGDSARTSEGAREMRRGPLWSADEATVDVIARVQADGTCWVGGATWFGQQVMRISISNWSTTEEDIDRSADAILDCHRMALQGRT
jgi:glutamate/tyrosine decarboxylase-like PLP-dependent enzyme